MRPLYMPDSVTDDKTFYKHREWFAWYPVWLNEGRWAWWRNVRRNYHHFGCTSETSTDWYTYQELEGEL